MIVSLGRCCCRFFALIVHHENSLGSECARTAAGKYRINLWVYYSRYILHSSTSSGSSSSSKSNTEMEFEARFRSLFTTLQFATNLFHNSTVIHVHRCYSSSFSTAAAAARSCIPRLLAWRREDNGWNTTNQMIKHCSTPQRVGTSFKLAQPKVSALPPNSACLCLSGCTDSAQSYQGTGHSLMRIDGTRDRERKKEKGDGTTAFYSFVVYNFSSVQHGRRRDSSPFRG